MESISIPNSVNKIEVSAFEGCSSLTSVTIPDNVTNLRNYAFNECSALKSIVIGNGITHIGDGVFRNCSALENIHCRAANPPTLGSNPFPSSVLSTCTLYVPTASIDSYKTNDSWKTFTNIEGE